MSSGRIRRRLFEETPGSPHLHSAGITDVSECTLPSATDSHSFDSAETSTSPQRSPFQTPVSSPRHSPSNTLMYSLDSPMSPLEYTYKIAPMTPTRSPIKRGNDIDLNFAHTTIEEFFEIYVSNKLDAIFNVEPYFPNQPSCSQLLEMAASVDAATFQQHLITKYSANNNNDIKSVFNVLYRYLSGNASTHDTLLESLAKGLPYTHLRLLRNEIKSKMSTLMENYLESRSLTIDTNPLPSIDATPYTPESFRK